MPNLQDDIGAAIVQTINDNAASFAPLGNTGGTLHAEYASQNVNYNVGATGNCLVKPMEEEVVEGTEYDASCQIILPYTLEFDLVDVFDSQNARSAVYQGLRVAFAERGAAMWANLTDSGSYRLGSSGKVNVRKPGEDFGPDPDRPKIMAQLDVKVWVNN